MLYKEADNSYTENYTDSRIEILKYHFSFETINDYKFRNINRDELYNSPIGSLEIENIIKELDPKKAPGHDNINGELIKMLANTHINIFLKVYNNIWESGVYSSYWKNTKVTRIPTEGKDLSSPLQLPPYLLASYLG